MDENVKNIDKELIKTQLIGAPGVIMIGLGAYGMFVAKGDGVHPAFDDMYFNYSLLCIGAVIAVWETVKITSLAKRRKKITGNKKT